MFESFTVDHIILARPDGYIRKTCKPLHQGRALAERSDLARDVVSNPLTERFFRADYQVKNECTIYDGTHEYRPDRIVITPDETWVVDFKTGKDLGVEHDAGKSKLRFAAMVRSIAKTPSTK